MITIERTDNTKVTVKLEDGPLGTTFWFNYQCGNEFYAALLARHFQAKLGDLIERVRKEEYNRGYKDGRSKRKKIDCFYSWLKPGVY